MSNAEEITIQINDSKVAAIAWGPTNGKPILALHGWLDNAASFIPIAPYLEQFRFVAVDLPGHGYSDHQPKNTYFHYEDYAPDVIKIIDFLGWKKCALLGHSLGAGVASIIAGAMPERFTAIGLIDGIGPISISAQQMPEMMCKSIEDYIALENKKLTYHASQTEAIKARLKASKMTSAAAELLVTRGIKATDHGLVWRTDPRLMIKPLTLLSESQIAAFLKNVTAKTCLLRPSPGWPFDEKTFTARIGYFQDIEVHRIDGDHHIHMDSPEVVGPILQEFYKRYL